MAAIRHEKTSRLVITILELVRLIAASLAGYFGGSALMVMLMMSLWNFGGAV